MKYIALIFLILGQLGFGQTRPTKTQLIQVLKENVSKKKSDYNSKREFSWITCNKDSVYFKSDTLTFYSNVKSEKILTDCCYNLRWIFESKNSMYDSETNSCKWVTWGKIISLDDNYRIEITEQNNLTILKRFRKKKLIESFNVINLSELIIGNDKIKSYKLVLVRMK